MSDAEFSAKSVRVVGRPFQKGTSGCPGGRPRQDVTALARAHTTEAIQALVEALKRPKEAVPAAVALLDRGWGKPQLTIDVAGSSDVAQQFLAMRVVGQQLLEERVNQLAPKQLEATAIDVGELPKE